MIGQTGGIDEVDVTGRYEAVTTPINPPDVSPCLGTANIVDPNLEAAIRSSLPAQGPQGGPFAGPISCQVALTLKVLDRIM